MTAFGKLLVFMNLLFSVVTGALIVFVFTTRANWVGAHKDAVAQAQAAEKAYKAEAAAHQNDLKQKDATLKELEAQNIKLNDRVAIAQQEAASARDLADKQLNLNKASTTQQESALAEVKAIRDERDQIDKEKNALRAQVVKIQSELDNQRGLAVQSELRAKNMEQKAHNLLRQVEELSVRNRELEAHVSTGTGSGSGAGSILEGAVKPPPPGVRGRVTGVSKDGASFAGVDIGSDSGLSIGNTLIVYRGAEYLGDLTLRTVEAKKAVGSFKPHRRTSTIKEGDLVATSLTGAPQ